MSVRVLDPCCGGRMMWFDKQNQLALFDQEAVEIAHMVNGSIAACASFIKQAGIEVAK